MKKISILAIVLSAFSGMSASAAYESGEFQGEITRGLDIVSAYEIFQDVPVVAPGALGAEVYETVSEPDDTVQMFIPTDMYMRMGGGLNLGFATDYAEYAGGEYESSGSYTTQVGLGWNLSSYVRTELDLQNSVLKFSDLDNHQATYQTLGGSLYFDLARRYVQRGDITRVRTFVPFVGVGAAVGIYDFQGANGADGMVIAAPRAMIGINIMLGDLIGLDIAYQYQMMIGNGFGWGGNNGGVNNISNLVASIRANF